ncbi:MAG TPA: hypothetical protein VH436_13285 [Vicinamibacterales bacterium]|jgi:hypothetical protein
MSDDANKPREKQPYVKPTLVTYGNITTLTQAELLGKKVDGGGKLKTKSNRF